MSVSNLDTTWQHHVHVTIRPCHAASELKMEDESCEQETQCESKPKQKRKLWKYFKIVNARDFIAACNECSKLLSYRTSESNLWSHFRLKHFVKISQLSDKEKGSVEESQTVLEDEVEETETRAEDEGEQVDGEQEKLCELKPKRRSKIWKYFKIVNARDRTATCNECFMLLSYRSTSANLWSHFRLKHFDKIPKLSNEKESSMEESETLVEDELIEVDLDKRTSSTHCRSAAWEYFTIADSVRRVATCKLCGSTCSYKTTVTNLLTHVRNKHAVSRDDDHDSDSKTDQNEQEQQCKSKPKQKRKLWKYFEIVNARDRIATCNECFMVLSYRSTTANLWRHFQLKHFDKISQLSDEDEGSVEESKTRVEDQVEEEDDEQDKKCELQRKRRSKVWNYFEIVNARDCLATCNVCSNLLSYRSTTTNLWNHLRSKHLDKIPKMSDEGEGSVEESQTVLEDEVEELETHVEYEVVEKDGGREKQCESKPKQKRKLWKYFEIVNARDRIATCNECFMVLSYRSTSANLWRHFQLKHFDKISQLSDEEEGSVEESETVPEDEVEEIDGAQNIQCKSTPKRRSKLWTYFKKVNARDCLATCNVCSKLLSYRSTTTNLWNHFRSKHSDKIPKLPDEEEGSVEESQTDLVYEVEELETRVEDEVEEVDGEQDKQCESTPKRRSEVWQYFEIVNARDCLATCNVCSNLLSYRSTTTNLWNHLRLKHSHKKPKMSDEDEGSVEESQADLEDEVEEMETRVEYEVEEVDDEQDKKCELQRKRRSKVWNYFEIVNARDCLATCNVCSNLLSYRSTTTNLWNHLRSKHLDKIPKMSDKDKGSVEESQIVLEDEVEEMETRVEYEVEEVDDQRDKKCESTPKRRSNVWNYFEIVNARDCLATCNVCSKLLSYRSTTTNLWNHLRLKHLDKKPKISDEDERSVEESQIVLEDEVEELETRVEYEVEEEDDEQDKKCALQRKRRSEVWNYFEIVNARDCLATCNVCSNLLSYRSTTTNLWNHLRLKHLHKKPKMSDEDEGSLEESQADLEDEVEETETRLEDEVEKVDDEQDKKCESTPKRRSKVWNYFEIVNARDRTATCNECFMILSYRSTSANLWNHFRLKHFDKIPKLSDEEEGSVEEAETRVVDEVEEVDDEKDVRIESKSKRRSKLWKYFEIVNARDCLATCNVCSNLLSYRSTTTNLWNHLRLKHSDKKPKMSDKEEGSVEESETCVEDEVEEVDGEQDKQCESKSKRRSKLWKYFEIVNARDCLATCNVCSKLLSYRSTTTNLWNHLRLKHSDKKPKMSDKEEGSVEESETCVEDEVEEVDGEQDKQCESKSKRRSKLWKYFEIVNARDCLATCNVCSNLLSYRSTTTNLWNHLRSKHFDKIPKPSDEEEGSVEESQTVLEDEVEEVDDEQDKQRESKPKQKRKLWKYFEIVNARDRIATCNECFMVLSYRSTTANLWRHFQLKHFDKISQLSDDEESSEEVFVQRIDGPKPVLDKQPAIRKPVPRVSTNAAIEAPQKPVETIFLFEDPNQDPLDTSLHEIEIKEEMPDVHVNQLELVMDVDYDSRSSLPKRSARLKMSETRQQKKNNKTQDNDLAGDQLNETTDIDEENQLTENLRNNNGVESESEQEDEICVEPFMKCEEEDTLDAAEIIREDQTSNEIETENDRLNSMKRNYTGNAEVTEAMRNEQELLVEREYRCEDDDEEEQKVGQKRFRPRKSVANEKKIKRGRSQKSPVIVHNQHTFKRGRPKLPRHESGEIVVRRGPQQHEERNGNDGDEEVYTVIIAGDVADEPIHREVQRILNFLI